MTDCARLTCQHVVKQDTSIKTSISSSNSMDRTSDFVKISVLFDTGAKRKVQTHRPLSLDARRAQQIADQLRQQELFLRDLQELVTKKAIIGDDPSAQIGTLTDVLKRELSAIEKNIQGFQQAINAQRGQHQQHHQAHFTIICSSLKSRCAKSVKLFHVRALSHVYMLLSLMSSLSTDCSCMDVRE